MLEFKTTLVLHFVKGYENETDNNSQMKPGVT